MIKIQPKYTNFTFMNGEIESFEEDDYSIFVLMPFGNSEEEHKKLINLYTIIKDVSEKACFHGGILKCSRADFETGLIIMSDICSGIKKAGLTVFEISKPNPNVYFELGLACSLDKRILLLLNPSVYYEPNPKEKLPFDIEQFRNIKYRNQEELREQLKIKIEQVIPLRDSGDVNLGKIYEKVKKITRHFSLDTMSEQIKEDYQLSDYEIEKTCDVLDEYLNNPELERNHYKGIKYRDIDAKIEKCLNLTAFYRAKELLRYIYWNGQY